MINLVEPTVTSICGRSNCQLQREVVNSLKTRAASQSQLTAQSRLRAPKPSKVGWCSRGFQLRSFPCNSTNWKTHWFPSIASNWKKRRFEGNHFPISLQVSLKPWPCLGDPSRRPESAREERRSEPARLQRLEEAAGGWRGAVKKAGGIESLFV